MWFNRLIKKINGRTAYIFTPIRHETDRRIKMWVHEWWSPRGKLTQFKVTDAKTGKKYKARTAHCGLPGCICDAVIYGYKTMGKRGSSKK